MIERESMKKPLTYKTLEALAAGHPTRDNFGPGTEYSCLPVYLEGSEDALGPWLQDLPCPIIGVGDGALANYCDVILEDERKLPTLFKHIAEHEIAAMVLVQHLRASKTLLLKDALTAESFAFATLQNGADFQSWASSHQTSRLPQTDEPSVLVNTSENNLLLTLNRPDTRNAIGVDMRDELCAAFDLALADNGITKVTLKANGGAFSIGGAIEEFGEVSDPATAHWVRSLRLPAWRLARFKGELHVHVNGAAIGAGAEIAAFGDYVTASSKAWFQLPELKYGLIPGAGGTTSIPRRIGRQRTAYMALSMEKIRAETALEWGLIDATID